jgi:hypothetical protein
MDIQNISKKRDKKQLSIRLEKETLDWIRKNGYSPTKIFKEAVRELGYNGRL